MVGGLVGGLGGLRRIARGKIVFKDNAKFVLELLLAGPTGQVEPLCSHSFQPLLRLAPEQRLGSREWRCRRARGPSRRICCCRGWVQRRDCALNQISPGPTGT